jgi:predicted GNAT family acetyltransferase
MPEVTDNAALGRYEMVVDGVTAFVTYIRQRDRMILAHTEVPKALGGRGVGSLLATGVLENSRSRGLRIVPECEFIAAFIKRHPEFADLVVAPKATCGRHAHCGEH